MHIKPKHPLFFLSIILILSACKGKMQSESTQGLDDTTRANSGTNITCWMTSPAGKILFQRLVQKLTFGSIDNQLPAIEIDTTKTYQTIEGFGNCLTGGSAMLMHKMSTAARAALLQELFTTEGRNIGLSYLRVSIGASDLDEKVFSYNDLPAGETDVEISRFNLGYDTLHLVPILKEILAINPGLKIMASPWSAPVWMKTNNDTRGGSLKAVYFNAYARYFVKYIQAMKAEGIRIDAITIQNEPLHPGNNPSMYMTAEDQAIFIKENLGPAFMKAAIDTKIIIYDHNADRPDYPLAILKDPKAAKFVDGSAFHLYAGKIEALSDVHDAYPDKNLYFTEQWIGAPGKLADDLSWHIKTLIIGGTRNWCRTVLEWNMAADLNHNPHTDRGGCDQCLGTITINGNEVTRNPAYYVLAHAAKFVRPGSVRIASNIAGNLPNVAFRTPDGQKIVIVLNESKTMQSFNIRFNEKILATELEGGAVGTYLW